MSYSLFAFRRSCGPWVTGALLVAGRVQAADPLVEKQAITLQKRAIEEDCLNTNYAAAITKLSSAVARCESDKCGATLRGALTRDLGAMLILDGLVDEGRVSFAEAIALDASLDLDPSYKNPMLERLWNDAKKKAATHAGTASTTPDGQAEAASEPPPRSPSGDRVHEAAKPTAARTADSDCPPNFPGCGAAKKALLADCDTDRECETGACVDGKCAEPKKAAEGCETDENCSAGVCSDGTCSEARSKKSVLEKARRTWVGVTGSLDLLAIPGAENVCVHTSDGTGTLNTAGYQCVDPSTGANFPGTDSQANRNIKQGPASRAGDAVESGVTSGNLRLALSFDYAVNMNVLLGARAGYVLFTDPASAPGPAFPPFHLEARATVLLGKDALLNPVAPMILAAIGVGEFDASIGVGVQLQTVGGKNENAWITAGPAFAAVGGGARILLGPALATTVAVKAEAAVGGAAGFLFGLAPEVGVQVGF